MYKKTYFICHHCECLTARRLDPLQNRDHVICLSCGHTAKRTTFDLLWAKQRAQIKELEAEVARLKEIFSHGLHSANMKVVDKSSTNV